MFNFSETTAIAIILFLAGGVIAWGYKRAKPFGKLGLLAWLQSIVLMAPWLLFFGLFAAGIYINLIGVLVLIIISAGIYIYLGKKLRAEGQETLLRERAAQRLQSLAAETTIKETENSNQDDSNSPELLPIPEVDLNLIKGIFSIDTYFATETISYQDGAIFRGNLRTDPDTAYAQLSQKLTTVLGEKYRLFLVDGTEGRPVIVVLPSTNDPQPMTLAQNSLAFLLLLVTVVTIIDAIATLLGFDVFQQRSRLSETLPLASGFLFILFAHEFGHRWMAKRYQIKLSLPFVLPTWQIGSFGAMTRFESLLPNRSILFDIAIAGPAVGGILSLIILAIGLVLSHPGSHFQLPIQFFQGSILVGSLARIILGDELQKSIVDIHPLTILGWLGLVVNALNLMPAGQLDGGRIVQAIYGRKTARRTTIATLIILGLVSIFNPANPIPLYWAVVIIFLQRDLERPSLNELSEPDDNRAGLALLALFLMLVTVIPLSPGLAGRLGIGG